MCAPCAASIDPPCRTAFLLRRSNAAPAQAPPPVRDKSLSGAAAGPRPSHAHGRSRVVTLRRRHQLKLPPPPQPHQDLELQLLQHARRQDDPFGEAAFRHEVDLVEGKKREHNSLGVDENALLCGASSLDDALQGWHQKQHSGFPEGVLHLTGQEELRLPCARPCGPAGDEGAQHIRIQLL